MSWVPIFCPFVQPSDDVIHGQGDDPVQAFSDHIDCGGTAELTCVERCEGNEPWNLEGC